MDRKKKIALLYGGKSGEHEVSLQSAASVFQHLDRNTYDVIPIGIDKQGGLHLNDPKHLKESHAKLPVVTPGAQKLNGLMSEHGFVIDADCVFPVIHGPLYEDGCLQGALTLANIAVVGSDVLSSAMAMDKDICRRVVCDAEIPCAQYALVHAQMNEQEVLHALNTLTKNGSYPLFVKPCNLGSSVGIEKVSDQISALNAIKNALRFDGEVLIEEFIDGREIELAVLEDHHSLHHPRCSIPGELGISHPDGFYSYDAKYVHSEETELIIPAPLPESLSNTLQSFAKTIFTRMKCKGMARVDFFIEHRTNRIVFNEINTLPGFTAISMYPKLWQHSGVSFGALLDALIETALTHHAHRQQRLTSYV